MDINDLIKETQETNRLLKQLIRINTQLLNFWIAVREEDLTGEIVDSNNYLEFLKEEGFKPPSG